MERTLPLHSEARREIGAPAAVLFQYLDDHRRLGVHMTQSSWMMLGSRMTIDLDDAKGQAAGSVEAACSASRFPSRKW